MKHSPGTTRDIEEWAAATTEARERRSHAAAQLAELVTSFDVQGNAALASARVRAVVNAERAGDPVLLRAAVMEAGAAFGAWAAELDATPSTRLTRAA